MRHLALVLAGGGGTRLSPLSTPETPKQFLRLFGEKTLFRETLERVSFLDETIIVHNESMDSLIKSDIQGLKSIRCIQEPVRKNTCPAVALAANTCDPDDILVVFPCDAYVREVEKFEDAINQAITLANEGLVVSVSTQPIFVSDQFGYVLGNKFIEKPDMEKAIDLINEGYQWNTGIYAFRVQTFQNLLLQNHPEIQINATVENFENCSSISFDKAISEKCDFIKNVPSDFYWSDVGTFSGLYKVMKEICPKDLEYDERPWGNYQVLRDDDIYKMKLLTIHEGEGISLQYHKHRTEIWHILEGQGTYINQPLSESYEKRYYRKDDTIEIPVGNVHQINAEKETKVFEVQIGDYFGEDDIIRIKDKYNRE